MRTEQHSRGLGRLILGIVLVAAGTVLLLDHLDIIDARAFFDYWPVLVIAFGLSRLTDPEHRCFGALVTLTGGWLLLRSLDIVDWRLSEVWPIALVVIGLCMVVRALTSESRPRSSGSDGAIISHGGLQ